MSMERQTAPITKLPPEIYPLVASHIPIQNLPSTLSALAVTSTDLYTQVHPLLYAKVIIKNEEHAYIVLERILADEDIGLLIRELHIMADFSTTTLQTHIGATLLTKLHEAIKTRRLSHMQTLRVVLRPGWQDCEGHDCLSQEFWQDVEHNCPLLRGLHLQGIGDTDEDLWMDKSGLYELKGLSNLRALGLKFKWQCPRNDGAERLLKSLSNLTSSLHTLTLCPANASPSAAPILTLTFPCLKALQLSGFILYTSEVKIAMEFWARHSTLERFLLTESSGHWFADNVEPGLLPDLTHLQAYYSDVRAMASHLPQLLFLSINDSDNCQIPYLLRAVLPEGLPKLRSLEINQRPSAEREIRDIEGAMWYETETGQFKKETAIRKACRTMTDKYYMHSIVRGAPNVQELCLQGFPLGLEHLTQLAPVLSRLPHLERLYFRAFGNSHVGDLGQSDIDDFILRCRPLADACHSLKSVTDVSLTHFILPYHVGEIIRDKDGLLTEIIPTRGFGMQYLGGDDDPFPQNPLRL